MVHDLQRLVQSIIAIIELQAVSDLKRKLLIAIVDGRNKWVRLDQILSVVLNDFEGKLSIDPAL